MVRKHAWSVLFLLFLQTTLTALTAHSQQRPLFAAHGNDVLEIANGSVVNTISPIAGPQAMVYDAQGNLYVVNHSRNSIVRITPDGVMHPFVSNITGAWGMTIDAGGNLYVSENGESKIVKITPGGVVSLFATAPINSQPQGLTMDGAGNLYAAFYGSGIYKITPGGTMTPYSNFSPNSTYNMVFDKNGNLYVNGGSSTVYKIIPGGDVITFAVNLAGPLAFDSQGNLLGFWNGALYKVTPAGVSTKFATVFNSGASYSGLVNNGHDVFVVADGGNSTLQAVQPDGSVSILETGFSSTVGMAIDNKGVYYVSDYNTGLISRLYADGSVEPYVQLPSGTRPAGEVFDSAGNLYVTDALNNKVLKVTPARVVSTLLSTGLKQPTGLTLDSQGYLYICNQSGGSPSTAKIIKMTTSGTNVTTLAAVAYPGGIVLDSAGTAYVSNSSAGTISKITPAGAVSAFASGLSGPVGMSLDSSGNLTVVGYQRVYQITPQGVVSTLLSFSSLAGMNQMAFAPQPTMWFQNQGSNQLAQWAMSGANFLAGAYATALPSTGFRAAGTSDFNNDGYPDIVLQNASTGKIAIWYMQGPTLLGGVQLNATVVSNYRLAGAGDFNGDGTPDLVFQNSSNNQLVVWYISGSTVTGGQVLPYPATAGWNLAAVGDFNRDGKPDMLFQNQSTGRLAIWYLNNTAYVTGVSIDSAPASGWIARGLGDYNSDGYLDIIFQNQTTGKLSLWYMQNSVYIGGGATSISPDVSWLTVSTN